MQGMSERQYAAHIGRRGVGRCGRLRPSCRRAESGRGGEARGGWGTCKGYWIELVSRLHKGSVTGFKQTRAAALAVWRVLLAA